MEKYCFKFLQNWIVICPHIVHNCAYITVMLQPPAMALGCYWHMQYCMNISVFVCILAEILYFPVYGL